MTLDRDMLEFVRTGLARYPDARETIGFFEEAILKSIVDALQQRQWRTFRPSTNNMAIVSKGKVDTFLHAFLEGSTKSQGKVRFVYLGIYWNDPVVAAVSICDEKWKELPLKLPTVAPDEGIKFDPSDQNLFLAVGKDFQPDADFKRLLDALEDAIKRGGL